MRPRLVLLIVVIVLVVLGCVVFLRGIAAFM